MATQISGEMVARSNLGEALERNAARRERCRLLHELMEDGVISMSKAAEKAKMTEAEFLEELKEFNLIQQ